jgi:uncharacterized protein YacL
MTKTQKIWLWIFIAMFAVPEILWSPVGNFVYSLMTPLKEGSVQVLRDNFLLDKSYDNLYSTILFIQALGLTLTLVLLLLFRKNVKNKTALWISYILSFFAAIVVFLLFGLSISLRHIGF